MPAVDQKESPEKLNEAAPVAIASGEPNAEASEAQRRLAEATTARTSECSEPVSPESENASIPVMTAEQLPHGLFLPPKPSPGKMSKRFIEFQCCSSAGAACDPTKYAWTCCSEFVLANLSLY